MRTVRPKGLSSQPGKRRMKKETAQQKAPPTDAANVIFAAEGFSDWTTKDHKVFSQSGLDINTDWPKQIELQLTRRLFYILYIKVLYKPL